MKHFFLLILCALAAGTVSANSLEELDQRVFDLEDKLSGKKPVTPMDSLGGKFGGVLYTGVNMAASKDYAGKKSPKDLNNVLRLDMYFTGDVTKDIEYMIVPFWYYWSPRTANNGEYADRSSEGQRETITFIYRLNAKFKFANNQSLTAGRYVAPFGTYLATYSPLSDQLSYWPQMVLPNGGITYSPVIDGLNYDGQTSFGGSTLKYNAYVGMQSVDGATFTLNDLEKKMFIGYPHRLIYGGYLNFATLDNMLAIGTSVQAGKRYNDFIAYGVDAQLNLGKFVLKGEMMKTDEDDYADQETAATVTTADAFIDYYISRLDSDKTSYYVEPSYRINDKFQIALRYDFIDFDSEAFYHNDEKTIIRLGLNYFPTPGSIVRIGVDKHDFKATQATADEQTFIMNQLIPTTAATVDPDYMEYSASLTLSF